jgi:hypothetical protein
MTKDRRQKALQSQLRHIQFRTKRLKKVSDRYAWARLAVVSVGLVVSALVFILIDPWYIAVSLVVTAVVFAIVVHFHRRVENSLGQYGIWSRIKTEQIARMFLDWDHLPSSTLQAEHPLEFDLDLVGEHSLHRLINTSVSAGGSQRLRQWLVKSVSDPQLIVQRQRLVRELSPLSLFRHKLTLKALVRANDRSSWSSSERLLAWMERKALPKSLGLWLLLLAVMAGINALLFALNVADVIGPVWRWTFVLYAGLWLLRSRDIGEPFRESAELRDALEGLMSVFEELENYSYRKSPGVKVLCAPFLDSNLRPSKALSKVKRIVAGTGIRGNPIIWLILNAIMPWDYFFAWQLDKYKVDIGGRLPGWMDTWFELEALNSLANHAYLNPHYAFPDIKSEQDNRSSTVFEASELGHPLIPDDEKICNDFTVQDLGQIDIFTGSNMSGKSTFLKTVGINLVLAFAGGPVDARRLRTIPFRLITCIRISDSVTDGVSYFYAEVKCLKALLTTLRENDSLPLFYFIDEIFRGTNNRERLIGSQAYIQALAGNRGVGLISTHDLELVNLADKLEELGNFHFRDDVVDGRMIFNYKLHSGPSPTTNALKIMRLEGLPV